MGMGGLGDRGPVTKFEKFSYSETPPRQRKRQGSSKARRARHPGRERKILGGLDGLVNVY